jgi:hypothetical protein
MAVDPRSGALFVSDGRVQVFRIEGAMVTVVAGRTFTDLDPNHRGFSGDGGPATEARLSAPGRLAVDPANGDLYISGQGNQRLRKVDGSGTIDGSGRLYITGRLSHSKTEGESVRFVATTLRRSPRIQTPP